jgi:sulfatase maturation enzyme AslB (radical SAM superfamily)
MLKLGIHTLAVFGGEPFHSSTREQLFAGAEENQDIEYVVCTNGTYLSQPIVINEVKRLKNILPVISLDGLRELNDHLRGKGTFQKVCLAMDSLQQERIFYGISTVVTKDNVREVCSEDFFHFLSLYGPGAIYFREVVGEDAPTTEEFEDFLSFMKTGIGKRNKIHVISGELRNPEKPECGKREYNCIHIEANGRVKKGRFGLQVGDLSEQSLIEILDSDTCRSAFSH